VRPSRAELTGDRLAADLLRDQRDHLTSEEAIEMASPGSWLDKAIRGTTRGSLSGRPTLTSDRSQEGLA
jgi:hypothetical protein